MLTDAADLRIQRQHIASAEYIADGYLPAGQSNISAGLCHSNPLRVFSRWTSPYDIWFGNLDLWQTGEGQAGSTQSEAVTNPQLHRIADMSFGCVPIGIRGTHIYALSPVETIPPRQLAADSIIVLPQHRHIRTHQLLFNPPVLSLPTEHIHPTFPSPIPLPSQGRSQIRPDTATLASTIPF